MALSQTELQILVGVVDKATEPLNAIERKIAGLTKQIAGYALAYVGIRAIYRSMTQAEDATAKLSRTLEGIGAKSGVTIARVNEIGKSIAASSRFGTTEVKIAAEQLVRFRAVSAQNIEPVLKITAALAQQMGTDLPQAAQVVSRAMLAPSNATRLLRQYGVQLSATQLEQIRNYEKLGQREKAQQILLAELNRLTNGGKLEVRTFSEAIKQLQNTISDLVEGPDGALTKSTDALKELNKTLADPETKAAADALFSLLIGLTNKWLDSLKITYAVLKDIFNLDPQENLAETRDKLRDVEMRIYSEQVAGRRVNPALLARRDNLKADLTADENAAFADNVRKGFAAMNFGRKTPQRGGATDEGGGLDLEQIKKMREAFTAKFVSEFGSNDDKIREQLNTWHNNINEAIKGGIMTRSDGIEYSRRIFKVLLAGLSDLDPVEVTAQKAPPVLNAIEQLNKEFADAVAGPKQRAIKQYMEGIAEVQAYMEEFGVALDNANIQDRLKELAESLNKTMEGLAKPKNLETEFEKEAQRNIQNAIEQFVLNPFKGGLRGLAGNIVNTFRQIIASLVAQKIAEGIMGSSLGKKLIGGIGKFVGGMFGSSSSGTTALAGGGNLSPNMLAMVGENGPELIATGRNAMSVLNARQMNFARAGAASITVAPVYQIDARGATTDLVAMLPAILEENTRNAVELARAAVMDDLSRGAMRRM